VASPLRRSQAAQIAQTGDLLVCPTNAGFIIGFDHAKREARWQYRYREEKVAPPSLPFWQAACPIVHKDRIIIAAADAPDIHCLDLDGKKKWTASVADGLYVATVHDDIVLIVSKNMCHALKISDGAEKWKLEIKTPAGIGVMDGSLYYLPLKKTIWAIDLAKGTKAHQLQAPYPDALGNLALHRGLIVSQSVTHIAAFPLAAK
jgi:outer membrane protein assembly factor BamB